MFGFKRKRKAPVKQELINEETGCDDDTYKGLAKDIHDLYLREGWHQ